MYRKNPKISETQKTCCIILLQSKTEGPKNADGMANSIDLDQIASGSTLFVETCLS